MGWAAIRHPFHPLRNQSFPVLKVRRVAGVDTLILRLEHGTLSVARAWTDWADPDPSLGFPPQRLDGNLLLDLVNLLEQLRSSHLQSYPQGIDK